jgi:hypothetical protein
VTCQAGETKKTALHLCSLSSAIVTKLDISLNWSLFHVYLVHATHWSLIDQLCAKLSSKMWSTVFWGLVGYIDLVSTRALENVPANLNNTFAGIVPSKSLNWVPCFSDEKRAPFTAVECARLIVRSPIALIRFGLAEMNVLTTEGVSQIGSFGLLEPISRRSSYSHHQAERKRIVWQRQLSDILQSRR